MIPRHLSSILKKHAKQYPVVTVTGPRQSGKTTLVKDIFRQHKYVTLEDPTLQSFFHSDPKGFLSQYQKQKIIFDEAQRIPELFSYLQSIVDENQIPGQFIITGSQNFLLLESISQTLAGRCAIHHLLPLSYAELNERKPFVFDFDLRKKLLLKRRGKFKTSDVFETLFTGFYPRIHDQKLDPQDWLKNYFQTYIERDIRSILNVGDLRLFQNFVHLCAGRTGQILNVSSLATDCGISHTTASRWLSLLESSFIIQIVHPYYNNFHKRVIKSPKLYFLDSGLLCFLLQIRNKDDLLIHHYRGQIFETFIFSEVYKNFTHNGKTPLLYFWRDSHGNEMDLLIEQGNKLVLIEIKSAQTITNDLAKNFKYWKSLENTPSFLSILVYAGEESLLKEDIFFLSWRDL